MDTPTSLDVVGEAVAASDVAVASGFARFNLPPSIMKELNAMEFLTPTPIQDKAIPVGLAGRDVMGMAQTGTGKTAAFVIPLMIRLMNDPKANALVLTPTRELAVQIHDFVKALAGKNFNLKSALLIGGISMRAQLHAVRSGPRIIIATPGRLVDHVQNTNPKMLAQSTILVLDEADRMLDMGFLPQLRVILKALPTARQTMMFSATFAPEIKKLAAQYLRNPAEVAVGTNSRPIEKIEQEVLQTTQKMKNEVLTDELNKRDGLVLIFTRTKHRTDRLARFLTDCGYSANRIHGNRTQAQRQMAIDGFKRGDFRILVATDIASRGLDIDDIAHVVNYDLPQVPEDYVHRIGRTARNGKGGKALTLLVPEDRGMWNTICRVTKAGEPIKGAAAGGASFAGSREAAQEQRQRQHPRAPQGAYRGGGGERGGGRPQRSGDGQRSFGSGGGSPRGGRPSGGGARSFGGHPSGGSRPQRDGDRPAGDRPQRSGAPIRSGGPRPFGDRPMRDDVPARINDDQKPVARKATTAEDRGGEWKSGRRQPGGGGIKARRNGGFGGFRSKPGQARSRF